MQAWAAEAVGLQRELENCYLREKMRDKELEVMAAELARVKAASGDAVTQMAVVESQLAEAQGALVDAEAREVRLRRELADQHMEHTEQRHRNHALSSQRQVPLLPLYVCGRETRGRFLGDFSASIRRECT